VLGRRWETTGELYLWSIIIGTLDSLPKIQARFGCELLKGKEAEDFLATVAASDNPVYRAYVRSRHRTDWRWISSIGECRPCGAASRKVRGRALRATPLTHSMRRDDRDFVVLCFGEPDDAEAFAGRFSGEGWRRAGQ
jgi:hypothetical protein